MRTTEAERRIIILPVAVQARPFPELATNPSTHSPNARRNARTLQWTAFKSAYLVARINAEARHTELSPKFMLSCSFSQQAGV